MSVELKIFGCNVCCVKIFGSDGNPETSQCPNQHARARYLFWGTKHVLCTRWGFGKALLNRGAL